MEGLNATEYLHKNFDNCFSLSSKLYSHWISEPLRYIMRDLVFQKEPYFFLLNHLKPYQNSSLQHTYYNYH